MDTDRLIDIHCHVLPGLDDGSRNMEESLSMLEIAEAEGITDIIATPHYKEGRHNASVHTILERMQTLQKKADERGICVTLHPGNEIYCFEGMGDALDEGRVLTLNGTDRVLIEFSPFESYSYIRSALDSVRGMDYIPVLAHAERYDCLIKHQEYVKDLKRIDTEIQVNASSAAGAHGYPAKRFIHRLLKEQLVDYVATDAHDSQRRAPSIQKCLSFLYRKYDSDYVQKITWENAKKMTEP